MTIDIVRSIWVKSNFYSFDFTFSSSELVSHNKFIAIKRMVYRRHFRMDVGLSAIVCLVWIQHGENCSVFQCRSWYASSDEFKSQISTYSAVSKNFCDRYGFGSGFWGLFVLSCPQLETSNQWYYKGCPITCIGQCRAFHCRSYSFPIQWFLIGNTIGIYW